MSHQDYYNHYKKRGFNFDRELLTTYCLSLYTKPFVILSGISGTGKTKIAQFFNTAANEALPLPKAPENAGRNRQTITLTVTRGMTSGDGRANFRYTDLPALLDSAEISALEPEIQRLQRLGVDDNIADPFEFDIETEDGTRLKAKIYLQRASSPLLRVRFKSKRNEPEYDSTVYFAKNYNVGDVLELEKAGPRLLKIISINDSDVTNQEKKNRIEELSRIKNSCFVSVKSDWTDSTPLFGYYNFIDQKYYLAPVIEFILKAIENPEIPFFLILDEMNLAKVEHYFSDFLSCLESRYQTENTIEQEPIHLHSQSGLIETNNIYFDLIEPSIDIPTNLYVTGTVNIDESTYMFSPKVLDRANVIELNEVDIVNYPKIRSNESGLSLTKFPRFTSSKLPSPEDFDKIPDSAKIYLRGVHEILSRHNLHFGYRVINEVSRFIINCVNFCGSTDEDLVRALDLQTVQKILPKLGGPQSKLENPIEELISFLLGLNEDDGVIDYDFIHSLNPDHQKFPLSTGKLKRMYMSLMVNGYTNFIE